MPVSMAQLCADLEAETAVLEDLVDPLDDPGWATPTPAEGWSVLDQVGHLAYFDDMAVLSATDAERFLALREQAFADPEGITETAAARYRTMPGADVLREFRSARRALLEAFRDADPKVRVPWYGPDMSAASSLTARIMETWAHTQDVVDALGAERPQTGGLRHVAHIGVRAFPNSFAAQGRDVPDAAVRVELTAPDGELWTWGPEGTAESVRGPAVDFALVVTRRRHVDDTALTYDGEVATEWMRIAQAFAGPPGSGRQRGQFVK